MNPSPTCPRRARKACPRIALRLRKVDTLYLHDSRYLYEPVVFQNESEFESFCVEHTQQVFWPWLDSGVQLYADRKEILKSAAGLKTVPDGFSLWLDEDQESSQLSMVEYEMEGHSVDEHIIPQLIRFQKVLDNRATGEFGGHNKRFLRPGTRVKSAGVIGKANRFRPSSS